MEKLVIEGGRPLRGRVRISGAKNAAVLAVQMLSIADEELAAKLDAKRVSDAENVLQKDVSIMSRL